MPFDSGLATFRAFDSDSELSGDIIGGFADYVAPPISTLNRDPISGWVSPRYLFDREISSDTCITAGYVRIDLMKAELKIPPALLRAYCREAEMTEMKARGVNFLNRQTRAEIKKTVVEALLPKMPPTLTSISTVVDPPAGRIYAEAMSDKQLDAFCVSFNKATRTSAIALTPEIAAMRLAQIDYRSIQAQCFSPDPEVSMAVNSIGMDFLTWLLFFWETTDASFTVDGTSGKQRFSLMLDGPAVFFLEGEGAHETALRKGMPLMGREAKSALEAGKKLRKVKLLLARDDQEAYVATVDGLDFAFRGLKLPKPETALDPASAFQERMLGIRAYTDAFYSLYVQFLRLLASDSQWNKTVAAMREWIRTRKTVI